MKIAIENCPMLFGPDQWPGGQNLMTTPAIWKKVFEILPSPNLGINYDPSHFVWQMIDYIRPIYEFKDKIFHVHYKDIKVYPDKLAQSGIMAYPLDFMSPKLPGLGDVDWGKYVSALTDIGYDGCTCIEIEDKAFEGSREKVMDWFYVKKKYKLNMPFFSWLTQPKLLLFRLTLHNTSPHIELAKDIHNDCGSALYYKMFRYIQIPTYMHAGS